jgi:hypothetical protein
MAKNRDDMLQSFLQNNKFIEYLESENICPSSISISKPSKNLLVEAVRKMVISYCLDESSLQTQKKINALISSEVKSS